VRIDGTAHFPPNGQSHATSTGERGLVPCGGQSMLDA
jgi:hypothetical protein